MRIQILNDLHNEINRLLIAGGRFAAGDPRIAKLVPVLKKMGEKAPVIKRLAEAADELFSTAAPSMALADIGVLLNAILSTQGDIDADNLTEAEATTFYTEFPQTIMPYSVLGPVVAALSKTGSSRYEVVNKAFENGMLNDFRLYPYIAKGLEDKYIDLQMLIAEEIIPSLGPVMIPYLLKDLNINGGKADARRLALLDTFKYEKVFKLAEKAVTDGTADIQVEAIRILGRNPAYEKLLLALTKDKKMAVRVEAIKVLCRNSANEELLFALAKDKNASLRVEAAKILGGSPANEKLLLELAKDEKEEVREAAFLELLRMNSSDGMEVIEKTILSSQFKPAVKALAMYDNIEYNKKMFERIMLHYEEVFLQAKTRDELFAAKESLRELSNTHMYACYENDRNRVSPYITIYKDLSNLMKRAYLVKPTYLMKKT